MMDEGRCGLDVGDLTASVAFISSLSYLDIAMCASHCTVTQQHFSAITKIETFTAATAGDLV